MADFNNSVGYDVRAARHDNRLKRLFQIAHRKKTNLVVSVEVDKTGDLIRFADRKSI